MGPDHMVPGRAVQCPQNNSNNTPQSRSVSETHQPICNYLWLFKQDIIQGWPFTTYIEDNYVT
jgi:hypothetical protein